MQNEFLHRTMRAVVAHFSEPKSNSGKVVDVDRDQLRTTLIQCELEVREMNRFLKNKTQPMSHRPVLPSSRY